ncbi:MAG: PaREP1 family protein [Methanophagales archaeon]|nr:PaREP1 family protein [Methanophagales archaeon]
MSEAVSSDRVEPEGVVITSVEEVKRFLNEGKELLEKDELVQACEKIYKAAEDAMKILAKEYTPEVYDVAEKNGKWLASLLREAVRKIEDRLGEDVGRGWYAAWFLHVEGFHERRLSKEDITWGLKHVKKLVDLLERSRSS